MIEKHEIRSPRWIVLALLLLPSALTADTVFLKGGGKVSGRIVSRSEASVLVDVGAGTLEVKMANVERIEEGASALTEYARRAGTLQPDDADGWRELGRWAKGQGLNTQAAQAYERVLAIAPGDPEAHEALGRVQVGGRWVSEEESYRARGYVKFEGEWMTPSEQQAILQERAADRDAERARQDQRAREAEERARQQEAARDEDEGIPLYWGWGTGPAAWPGTTFPRGPTTLPARNRDGGVE